MEKVALSNVQLDYLANSHPLLGKVYSGALPCDKLPRSQYREDKQAFIVNTDPHDKPGTHWIALWTDGEECELFDSFALPLRAYTDSTPLVQWLERHYLRIEANARSVQAVTSQTCGYYALFYLMHKSMGGSMSEFLAKFKKRDFMWNDRIVGQLLRQMIEKDGSWNSVCCKPYSQCNK